MHAGSDMPTHVADHTAELLYAPEPSSVPVLKGVKQLVLGGGHALAVF